MNFSCLEPGTGKTFGREVNTVSGLTPCPRAEISVNGLKAEPGWRCPLVARLNGVVAKSLPPTIALISPVLFWMATSEAVGPTPLRRLEIARSAAAWSCGSSVVLIFRPPPNTTPGRYRSTSCCVNQLEKYGCCESGRGGVDARLGGRN